MIIEINEKTVDQESLKIDVDSKKESKKQNSGQVSDKNFVIVKVSGNESNTDSTATSGNVLSLNLVDTT